jgi:hypothetical protein
VNITALPFLPRVSDDPVERVLVSDADLAGPIVCVDERNDVVYDLVEEAMEAETTRGRWRGASGLRRHARPLGWRLTRSIAEDLGLPVGARVDTARFKVGTQPLDEELPQWDSSIWHDPRTLGAFRAADDEA